jgi:hypothetical protein
MEAAECVIMPTAPAALGSYATQILHGLAMRRFAGLKAQVRLQQSVARHATTLYKMIHFAEHQTGRLKRARDFAAGLCVRQKPPDAPSLPRLRLAPQGGTFASEQGSPLHAVRSLIVHSIKERIGI